MDGKRPDAVVISEFEARSLVIFVELKATGRDGRSEHGQAQVLSGAHHFAPAPRSHGRMHHDAWARDDDLPMVRPSDDHEVLGIAVAFRAGARVMPNVETIAGKVVQCVVVQVPMARANRAEIELADLLALAGMT